MSNDDNPFSIWTMLDALPQFCFATARDPMREETPAIPPPPPRGVSAAIPPPGFTTPPRETNVTKENQPSIINQFRCAFLAPQELETRLQWMFNFMTNTKQDSSQFKEIISKLDRGEHQRMASLLTSDSDYFMAIARNEHGSKRLQKLFGKSDDVDTLFYAAILRRFLHVMTDKHASHVAVRGMRVFDGEKKESMYEHSLHYALHLASDQHGCVALNEIITDLDHPYYRNQLLDIVADNALFLSNDAYGNFVIQHVLKLNDLRSTHNIAVRLHGHCIELSFLKHGSYIVERLLEAEESVVVPVIMELIKCGGDRLTRLARSEYGNFVVGKALRVTQELKIRPYLFWGLAHKLVPYLHLLRKPSRASNIAAILDSIVSLSQTS